MAKVALLSGGKDSFLAMMRAWPVDAGLVLVYRFPEPSPHLVNLGASVASLTLTGVPVMVVRLPPGKGREWTVKALLALGATEIVAGDVYVEDHLRYLEGVASEAGARLAEPLWGGDTRELLVEAVRSGIRALVIGARSGHEWLLGRILDEDLAREILERSSREGWDPLGENGEYHTLVLDSPLHKEPLRVEECGRLREAGVSILRVCPRV